MSSNKGNIILLNGGMYSYEIPLKPPSDEKDIINLKKRPMNKIEHWENLSLVDITEEIDGQLVKEVWKDIPKYKGVYQISNFGRCKSMKRWVPRKGMKDYLKANKILTQSETDDRGYVRVALTRNSITEYCYVHQLVGKAFISNPEKRRTVNHKWGNKKDNRVSSLEWHTHGENHTHSYRLLGRKHSMKGKTGYAHTGSREVLCITTGQVFGSLLDAGRELKVPFQNISKVCKGRRPNAHGLVFKYIDGKDQ